MFRQDNPGCMDLRRSLVQRATQSRVSLETGLLWALSSCVLKTSKEWRLQNLSRHSVPPPDCPQVFPNIQPELVFVYKFHGCIWLQKKKKDKVSETLKAVSLSISSFDSFQG